MSDLGLVSEVTSEVRGSFLAAALTIGDAEVIVEYGGDFDNEGGTFDLNGTRIAYASVTDGDLPEDPDTLTLVDVSAIGADEGDTISVVVGGQVAVDYWAVVEMDNAPAVMVPLKYDQLAGWPVGIYDPAVPVLVSEDLQHLEDAPGRTPIGRSLAWNRDYADATADDTAVTIQLTWLPAPDSMQIKQNGIELDLSEWTYDSTTNTVTITPVAEVVIRSGQRFRAYYDRDGAADALVSDSPPPPTIVDTVSTAGPISSIALPAGTQAGDTIIAVVAFYSSGTISDSRFTLDHSFSGTFVPMAKTYIGTEDGSGDPIGCSLFGATDVVNVIVLRGGTIVDQGDPGGLGKYAAATGASSGAAPSLTSAAYAVTIAIQRNNLASTNGIVRTGAYADAEYIHVNPCAVLISTWDNSGAATTTPADTYTFAGTVDGIGLATYEVAP